MRERWPQAREVIYRWSGQVLEPNDYIAFIGRNPGRRRERLHGVGRLGTGHDARHDCRNALERSHTRRPNEWESLYDPRRVSLRAKPMEQFAKENADVALQYIKEFVTRGDVSSEADIPRGEGRVVRHGLHKVAAYCDEDGAVHIHSAALHASQMHRAVELGGEELGLSLPRIAVRSLWQSAQRARDHRSRAR